MRRVAVGARPSFNHYNSTRTNYEVTRMLSLTLCSKQTATAVKVSRFTGRSMIWSGIDLFYLSSVCVRLSICARGTAIKQKLFYY